MGAVRRFDVAIVGASVAGCAAARLLGLAGARVALLERRPDPQAYKVVCTHALLPCATATIERLGLPRCSSSAARCAPRSSSGRRSAAGCASATTPRGAGA